MEYRDVARLFEYWKVNPPTHIMVQGFFKMGGDNSTKPVKDGKVREMSPDEFAELTGFFGGISAR